MLRRLLMTIAVGAALALPATAAADSLVGFASPTRNIGCYMDTTQVRCDIRQRSWKPPRRPRSCPLDYGQGVTVAGRGRAGFVCAGDTALDGQRPLAYGRSISRGPFRCTSLTSAMRCVNLRTGHGFALSRQRVVLF